MLQEQQRPLEVVCVAAPEDASFLAQWEEYLVPLQEEGYLTAWSEQHLSDEASRQEEISEHLRRADLILLLISPHFFAATECLAFMEQALHRHTGEEARVICLLLQPIDGQEASPTTLLYLPSNGLPIAQWDDIDVAFRDCLQEIFPLVQPFPSDPSLELQQEKEHHSSENEDVEPYRAFSWSWRRALSSLPGSLLIGITGGLAVIFLYGLFVGLSDGLVVGLFYALFGGLSTAFPMGLLIGLLVGILGALLGSAIYGFSRGQAVAHSTHYTIEENEEPIV